MLFLPTWIQKSQLVPGLESAELVSLSITCFVFSTVSPTQTITTTGLQLMGFSSPGKNGWSFRSMECCFRSSSEACRSFVAMRWNPCCSKCLMISPTRAHYILSSLIAITLCSRLAMARMLAVHSCLMGLESTLALLVLVSKYLWSYILGIYSIFLCWFMVFFLILVIIIIFYHSFPSLFWTLYWLPVMQDEDLIFSPFYIFTPPQILLS